MVNYPGLRPAFEDCGPRVLTLSPGVLYTLRDDVEASSGLSPDGGYANRPAPRAARGGPAACRVRQNLYQHPSPILQAALDYALAGDILVVWKLAAWPALGRSLLHLIEMVQMLQQREIGFQSLREDN